MLCCSNLTLIYCHGCGSQKGRGCEIIIAIQLTASHGTILLHKLATSGADPYRLPQSSRRRSRNRIIIINILVPVS